MILQLPAMMGVPDRRRPSSAHSTRRWTKPNTFLACGMTLIVICVAVLALCIFAVIRLTSASGQLIELPSTLLPGQPLPRTARCDVVPDGHDLCYVTEDGVNVYFTYDGASRVITSTVLRAGGETIGDLIIAWGTPTGFRRVGSDVEISWGRRSAYLVGCTIRPTSQVQLIALTLKPKQLSPWRGFANPVLSCADRQ